MARTSNAKTGILACIIFAAGVAAAVPVTALAAQGDSPMTPMTIEVKAQVPISADLEKRLTTVIEAVVRENLSGMLAKSTRADVSASILEQSANGYVVEVLAVCLFRQTFTAQMARIEFTYRDDRVSIRSVESDFHPK